MADVTPNMTALSKGVTEFARDAAYVAVGLGVMGLQRAQVRRVELQRRLTRDLEIDRRISDVRDGAAKGRAHIDDLAGSARQLVGSTLHPLEERLPTSLNALSAVLRDHTRGVRIHIPQRPRS